MSRVLAGARGMVVKVEKPGIGAVRLSRNLVKMSETDLKPRCPASSLAGDTEDVLGELLSLTVWEIEKLRREGAL